MRSLVVAQEYQWLANKGARLMLHVPFRSRPTHLFSITSGESTDIDGPDRS
jgi:hypothetical protein